MTTFDYEHGRLLNWHASENFEHGDDVVRGVGVAPNPPAASSIQPPAGGLFSSGNLANTLTTGVSWARLAIALVPLLFSGKKK